MKTKIIISRNEKQHQNSMNSFFNGLGETDKLMIFHKIVRVNSGGFSFISYLHYTLK
jgi:hypothetical protein